MRLLALDTALGACSAAVLIDGRLAGHRHEVMARGHAERLLPMAEEALAEAGLGWDGLTRLAVSIGPGTFTGVRTALATARGLALALDLPLAGITTLAAVAAAARKAGPPSGLLLVALDAHGGLVYAEGFAGEAGTPPPQALAQPGLHDPQALAALLEAEQVSLADLQLAGSGANLVRAALGPAGEAVPVLGAGLPDAADVARLAAALPMPERSTREQPHAVPSPLYLRAPDARLPVPRAGRPG